MSSHLSTRQIEPIVITGTDEEKAQFIRQNNSRVKSDLRSLATGLEAYFVDNNTYPRSLSNLTSPIAYLSRMFKDPYTLQTEYGYEKRGNNNWIVWSIGPDGKDQGGREVYQEGQGLESKGDIIRVKQ